MSGRFELMDEPSSGRFELVNESGASGPLPANAGLARFASSVVGLPVDTVENALNLGKAAIGAPLVAMGRPDLAPTPSSGSVGGSEWIRSKLRATGMPGLNPDNPTPNSPMGTAQYDLTARGGFIPGGFIPAAASMAAEKIGGPQWGPVGAMASPLVAPVAQAIGKGAGFIAKQALGLSTGVGPENVANAYKAGQEGDTSFTKNMSGDVPMTDVVDAAKKNLLVMKQQKNSLYRSGMVDLSKDTSQLKFDVVDKAISDAEGMTKYKGEVTNQSAFDKVGEMKAAVEKWQSLDPAQFHTPEGMDALKQKLGGILEDIPYNQTKARLAAGKVYNAVKDTITDQAPQYAKVMKDYSQASDLVNQIEKTIVSGKPGASVDTALRKLQSLTRNNVNTNYGNRLDLARQLQEQGGTNLMPAISGQAMSSWTPRGLASLIPMAEGPGAVWAAFAGHPAAAAAAIPLLATQSPRLVGNAVYGAGRLSGAIPSLSISPQQAALGALMAQRTGALAQP